MMALDQRQLEQHITIVGWLEIVGNLIFLLIGAFIFVLLTSIGAVSGDEQAVVILSLVGALVGVLLAVIGLPGIVAGFGLLAHKAWARYLAIVVGVLSLVNFPIGTVIGIYTLWVLLQEKAMDYFAPAFPGKSGAEGKLDA
jgi:hypothetical protein